MFEYEDDEDDDLELDSDDEDCPNPLIPCDKCKYWDKKRSRCKYKDVKGIF